MRKILWLAALALSASTVDAQVPWPTPAPVTFQGCDGVRSCHTITARLVESGFYGPGGYLGKYSFFISGVSTFYERGAILDCGLGCAWSTNGYSNANVIGADWFHAGQSCFSTSVVPVLGDNARMCSGGEVDNWGSGPFTAGGFNIFDQNWRPEWIDLRLIYQAENRSPNVTIATLRLNLVPEPSTYALMGAGLLALGFVARRRRQA